MNTISLAQIIQNILQSVVNTKFVYDSDDNSGFLAHASSCDFMSMTPLANWTQGLLATSLATNYEANSSTLPTRMVFCCSIEISEASRTCISMAFLHRSCFSLSDQEFLIAKRQSFACFVLATIDTIELSSIA